MARGKEAAKAARRQQEAAMVMAERLADKNADLKHRARQVEAAAARVPALDRRVAELTAQLEAACNPRVAELERQLVVEREASKALADELRRAVRDLALATSARLRLMLIDYWRVVPAQSEKEEADRALFVAGNVGAESWIPEWLWDRRSALGLNLAGVCSPNNREHRRGNQFNDLMQDHGAHVRQDNLKSEMTNLFGPGVTAKQDLSWPRPVNGNAS